MEPANTITPVNSSDGGFDFSEISKEVKTSFLSPKIDFRETSKEGILKSLEASQAQFLEDLKKIETSKIKNISKLVKKQTEQINAFINSQNQSSKVNSPYSEPEDPIAIIRQTQQEILERLNTPSQLKKQPNTWQSKGLYRYRKAMENQSLIENKMANLSNSVNALSKCFTTTKLDLLIQPTYIEEDILNVKITTDNFNEKILDWKSANQTIGEDKLNKISKVFWKFIDEATQKVDFFFNQFDIINLAMGEGYKEVGKHLSYLEKNEAVPEFKNLKNKIKREWDTLAGLRLKLAFDKHFLEAYTVAPRLRSLRNQLLANIKQCYMGRKNWELVLPKELSLLCTGAIIVDRNNSQAFSKFTDEVTNCFNLNNKLLADIYKDCKAYFSEPIDVKIYSSQPSFSDTPFPPTVEGNENLYFFDTSKIENIKLAAEIEKKATWSILYKEIHFLKKLMLELAAHVNYICNIRDTGRFTNWKYFDIRRRAFAIPALCKFLPTDPKFDVSESLKMLREEYSQTIKSNDRSETETESESKVPQSGYSLSDITDKEEEHTDGGMLSSADEIIKL